MMMKMKMKMKINIEFVYKLKNFRNNKLFIIINNYKKNIIKSI